MKRRSQAVRRDNLRTGFIFLVAWIGVAIAQIAEFRSGGLLQIVSRVKTGDVFPIVLISLSVVLLALAIRSFVFHFRRPAADHDKNT